MAARPDIYTYYDQFADLFDLSYGRQELGHTRPVNDHCKSLMELSHFQLQAAAAVVTGAYDFRGAVQSALIGTELALKAGLAANGEDENKIKTYGHILPKAIDSLAAYEPKFDADRVRKVAGTFPPYVANRYSPIQPERREIGHIIMGAQYIASEVMRQLSIRNFRTEGPMTFERVYPSI
jgi:hypothetical protein